MNRTSERLGIAALLAVVLPGVIMHFCTVEDRLTAGLSAAPFGWPRVFFAHLITALPVGFLLAGWMRALPTIRAIAWGWWPVLGLTAIGLMAASGPGIGEWAATSDVGPIAMLVLRSTLALGLVLPWCLALTKPGDIPVTTAHPGLVFGVASALTLIPCGLYADIVISTKTEQARDLLDRQRPKRALFVVNGLCELGSDRPIGKRTPTEVRQLLTTLIPKLRQAVDRPLAATAPVAARIHRAGVLVQLDQLDDAATWLQPLASTNDTASLLLAAIYRDQERWAESDALYSNVLRRQQPRINVDGEARDDCFTALEGLVYNARLDRRPEDAERALRLGLEILPTEAAYFHFQLGQHYVDGGRPDVAIDHLRTAAKLDPTKYGDAASTRIDQLRTTTSACLPRITSW